MKKLSCGTAADLFDEYIDKETPPETSKAIEEHIAGCPACRAELERRAALHGAVSGALGDIPSPPPELHGRIMAAVHAEASSRKRRMASFYRSLAAAAAALALFVGIGAFAFLMRPMMTGDAAQEGNMGGEGGEVQAPDADAFYHPENNDGAAGGAAGVPAEDEALEDSDAVGEYAELFYAYGKGYDGAHIIAVRADSSDDIKALAASFGAAFDGRGFVVPYTEENETAILVWGDGPYADADKPYIYGDADGAICIIVYVKK